MKNIKNTLLAASVATAIAGCSQQGAAPQQQAVKALPQDDAYLWLEEVEGQKALAWVDEQNKESTKALENNPAFQQSYDATLKVLNSNERIPYASQRGDYLYNFWQDKDHQRGIYRRTTLEQYRLDDPKWETVLDIDALAAKDGQSWVYKGMDCLYPDYNRCLVRLSPGGTDAVVVREFDMQSKSFVQGGFELPEAKSDINWKDKDHVYVGTDFGPGSLTDSGYPAIIKLWKRGTPLSDAKTLYTADKASVAATGYRMHGKDGAVDILYDATTFYTNKVFMLDNGEKVLLPLPKDAQIGAYLNGQLFVQLTSDWTVNGASFKQGSIIHADIRNIAKGNANFKLLLEPSDSLSISNIKTTKSALLVTVLDNVRSQVLRYSQDSRGQWQKTKVNLDDTGTLSVFNASEASDDFFVQYASFLSPSSLYRVEGETGKVELLKSQTAQFDASNLVTKQHWATSKDGTKVPYFIVMRKDIKLDGSNPTLLYGYGGFEVSLKPFYSSTVGVNWLSKGGVYVLSNIRGGGEFGPRWHQAALKKNRHKAYEDFEAIAEDLIDRGITSPRHLGIQGGSNGGLLMGAALTRRPELYNAVVCQVPLLDMKRYTKLLAGASWAAEYGDPDKPEMWDYIKTYSPFHNLDAGKDYPKVFFTTSTKDDRVHPGHARKMVARMKDMGKDLYYFENTEGGHAGAADNKQRAYVYGLTYSYLWERLGGKS